MEAAGSGLLSVLVVLAVVIGLLWVLLPFAVFGVKDLIREALGATRETNRLLGEVIANQEKAAGASRSAAAAPAPEVLPQETTSEPARPVGHRLRAS